MSSFRLFLLVSLASLIVSFGLLALASVTRSGSGYGISGGYAVLEVDALTDDRLLRERLKAGALESGFADSLVSESSQWAMLTDFNSLQTIPLDKYFSRIFPFDPRNDGYAEKLKDVFVKGDKRFVFIPLNRGARTADLQLDELLRGVSFSVKTFNAEKPLKVFFIIYALSCAACCIVCLLKKNAGNRAVRNEPAAIIALLPPLFPFAFFGVGGFAAAALILGLCVCLKEPLNELLSLHASPLKEVVLPYKTYWIFAFFFTAAIGIVTALTELKLLFVLPAGIAVCALYFFSLRVLLWKGKQRRFAPVLIMRRRTPDLAFSLYMLPFAAAALFAVVLTPFISSSFSPVSESFPIVTEQEYYDHLAFQSSFSTRQIGGSGGIYPSYKFDKDGLPSASDLSTPLPSVNIYDYPPFPLKHLMAFLTSVNTGGSANIGNMNQQGAKRIVMERGFSPDITVLPVLLVFLLPGFFSKGKIRFPSRAQLAARFSRRINSLKRFSLSRLRRDINRKNTLLLNSRNNLLIRKDA